MVGEYSLFAIPLNKYVDTYIRGEKYIKNKRQGVFT